MYAVSRPRSFFYVKSGPGKKYVITSGHVVNVIQTTTGYRQRRMKIAWNLSSWHLCGPSSQRQNNQLAGWLQHLRCTTLLQIWKHVRGMMGYKMASWNVCHGSICRYRSYRNRQRQVCSSSGLLEGHHSFFADNFIMSHACNHHYLNFQCQIVRRPSWLSHCEQKTDEVCKIERRFLQEKAKFPELKVSIPREITLWYFFKILNCAHFILLYVRMTMSRSPPYSDDAALEIRAKISDLLSIY